jgi:hypothetical protein
MKVSLMKKILCALALLATISLIPGCSSNGLSSSNKVVCAEVAEIMKGSGYMEGTRESLMNAAIDLALYDPPYVDDWVTYRRAPQDYAPSLNDNDNPVYQNLYRLQAQAIDYIDSRNAGAYYNEWSYFERGCGFTEE